MEEKRFSLLSNPSDNDPLPYKGIPLLRGEVLGIISMDEALHVDRHLKEIVKNNSDGCSRRAILVDYVKNSIFFVMDAVKENMVDPEKWEPSLFAPRNGFSPEYHTTETDYYTQENYHLLKDTPHYIIKLFKRCNKSADKVRNRASLEHYLTHLGEGWAFNHRF